MGQCIGKVLCGTREPEVSSNIEEIEENGTGEFEGSSTEEFKSSSIEEFEGSNTKKSIALSSNIEEIEESGTGEFKGNGTEEFENSSIEKFEESNTKESKALDDWFVLDYDGNYFLVGMRIADYYLGNRDGFVLGDSFEFGKSGNTIIDDFVFEKKLKWIPYNKFKNVEYLNEGGFGAIYKATWLKNNSDEEVILKCHKNLNENLNEFLKEWECHITVLSSNNIINFYGFTEDPNISKYMVVMEYANKGNLRENLTRIVKNNWNQKLYMLFKIISGLNEIHEKNLIHCDFHDGNILNHNDDNKDTIYISDLGLCQPVKSFLKKYDIYGVMSFMAPEVLRGKPYIPASDIYSFSMIMWEFTSGVPPFNNRAHDIQLSLSICKGERPEIIENTPQCYVDLMKKCWNEDSSKRPSSKEVLKIIGKWIFRPYKVSEELKSNIMEFINAPIGQYNNLVTESHPQACYTSRLLDFTSKKLNEMIASEDLSECMLNLKPLDENTSKKLNEILESEDSQASVKANEMLVSEDFIE